MTGLSHPAQRRNFLLSTGFFGFLAIIGVLAFWVGTRAETAILQSQAGEVSTFSSDPTAPGFRAFTTTSDTALVLHTAVRAGVGADLVGVNLLTGADGAGGGSVVTIPATFVNPDGSGVPLAGLFATSGLDAVVDELRVAFQIGFGDVVVLDASSWTGLMIADLPLTLSLRDDLIQPVGGSEAAAVDGGAGDSAAGGEPTATEVVLAAGTRDFALAEIAVVAGHRNPGEPSLGVALRQQEVWRSWIARTAGTAERPELFEQESGFAELIGELASAEVSYRTVATLTVPADAPEATTYEADLDSIADLISQIVPFPTATELVDRPSVLLLDPSLGAVDQLPVVSAVTRAGGLVTVLGNGDGVTALEPEVQVHDQSAFAVAREIASRLGYGAPRAVPLDDATTAITVVANE